MTLCTRCGTSIVGGITCQVCFANRPQSTPFARLRAALAKAEAEREEARALLNTIANWWGDYDDPGLNLWRRRECATEAKLATAVEALGVARKAIEGGVAFRTGLAEIDAALTAIREVKP